ncbi:MAG: hypothetical protein N2248_06920 [candidate division WOR-3 bacterium]|uniref:Outer membrane protein beta-barrel domain-containing protein n=1 Tax=candidate division WOR-3 bacterium TaxID=2052148 RepID=A0A7C3IY35_UNCW3|nr:hypothetical protein [candidate division WOR-3 bacterium]
MRWAAFVVSFAVGILRLSAQEPEAWLVPFGCAFEHDIQEFNQVFVRNNLPEFSRRIYGWGVELRSLAGGNILIGPMYFRVQEQVRNDSFQLRTETWSIMGEAGLKLPIFGFMTVTPMIGLGGVQPAFQVKQLKGDVELDSLLKAPGRMASFSPGIKLAGLAALEISLNLPTKAGKYGVALRGGYLYSPFALRWCLPDGSEVRGAPDSRIRGFWVSAGLTLIPAPEVETE